MKIFLCGCCIFFYMLSANVYSAPSYMQKKNKAAYGEKTFFNKVSDFFSTKGKTDHEKRIILKNKSRNRMAEKRRKDWAKKQKVKKKKLLAEQKKIDKQIRKKKAMLLKSRR